MQDTMDDKIIINIKPLEEESGIQISLAIITMHDITNL